MTTTSFPRIPTNSDLVKVIIAFNSSMDELDYQLGGFLDWRNISRFANFAVNKDDLKHQSGVVGISGAEPNNPEAIRFYAGDDIAGDPNFKVTQAGIMTAVAGAFLSAMGYPRITFNESEDSLLKASLDADTSIYITPDFVGGAPALVWEAIEGGMQMFIKPDGSGDFMVNGSSGKLNLTASSDDVVLKCASGHQISVNSWSVFYNRATNQSLQSELSSLLSEINSLKARVFALESAGP